MCLCHQAVQIGIGLTARKVTAVICRGLALLPYIRQGRVCLCRWQVTLCDPIRQVRRLPHAAGSGPWKRRWAPLASVTELWEGLLTIGDFTLTYFSKVIWKAPEKHNGTVSSISCSSITTEIKNCAILSITHVLNDSKTRTAQCIISIHKTANTDHNLSILKLMQSLQQKDIIIWQNQN